MPKPTTPLPLPTCQRSSILWLQIITRLLTPLTLFIMLVTDFMEWNCFSGVKTKYVALFQLLREEIHIWWNTSIWIWWIHLRLQNLESWKKSCRGRLSYIHIRHNLYEYLMNMCVCVFDSRDWYPPPPIIPSYKLLFTTSACFWSVSNKIIKYTWNAIHSYQFK